jgi:hypothetical protein
VRGIVSCFFEEGWLIDSRLREAEALADAHAR